MSWKAHDFDSRELLGEYKTEMDLSQALARQYPEGKQFIVENDDGQEFAAMRDGGVVKIISDRSIAQMENDDMYDDENYTPDNDD